MPFFSPPVASHARMEDRRRDGFHLEDGARGLVVAPVAAGGGATAAEDEFLRLRLTHEAVELLRLRGGEDRGPELSFAQPSRAADKQEIMGDRGRWSACQMKDR